MDLAKCLVIKLNNIIIRKENKNTMKKWFKRNQYIMMILLGGLGVGIGADFRSLGLTFFSLVVMIVGIMLSATRSQI